MLNAVDLRALRARGAWYPVAWLLAAAIFEAVYTHAHQYWPALVKLFGPHDVLLVLAVVQAANVGQELIWTAVMALIMRGKVGRLEKYKINPKPWPWESSDPDTVRRFEAVQRATFWRALIVNNVLINTPLLAFNYYHLHLVNKHPVFESSPAVFPSRLTVLWQVAVAMVIEDMMFYWSHRTLHTVPWLYTHVHKVHHQYTHPVTQASEHAHPLEFIFGNLVPVIVPAILLKMHLFTAAFWVGLRIFVSAEEHCGYAFPWSPVRLLPFQASVEGHDFHHR